MSAVIQELLTPPPLPWNRGGEEDARFRRILLRVAAILLLLSLVIPFLPVVKLAKPPPEPEPRRYVRLLMEPQPIPPPAQSRAEVAPTPEPRSRSATASATRRWSSSRC